MAITFGKSNKIIGLDIDGAVVALTELVNRAGRIHLVRFKVFESLGELTQEASLKGEALIVNLPSQVVLMRSFRIPESLAKSRFKRKAQAEFLATQNLPFNLSDCYWDIFILHEYAHVVAVKKEALDKHLAEFKCACLSVTGVSVAHIALYNVFIYNYPEKIKENFMLLNLKRRSSDLLIHELERLWVYPLSMGRDDLKAGSATQEKFSQEIKRILSAHYLQNPVSGERASSDFYLSGQDPALDLALFLKRALVDSEIKVFDCLRRISARNEARADSHMLSLSLGAALAYLKRQASSLNINLIQESITREQGRGRSSFFIKASVFFFIGLIVTLLFWNIKMWQNFSAQLAFLKNSRSQMAEILPEAKTLKAKQETLQNARDYLQNRLRQNSLYLEALAAITQSKPPVLRIKEFDAKITDNTAEVFLSADNPTYEGINSFVANLKNKPSVRDVKIMASTLPGAKEENKVIDFKLRFEIGNGGE